MRPVRSPRVSLVNIKIGFDIEFELLGPTPMILMLYVHPSRQKDLLAAEKIVVEPNVALHDFSDLYGNRCARILAPAGNLRLSLETTIEDSGEPDAQAPDAIQHPIEELPDEVLPFLLTSRYCEVDKLFDIAWKLWLDRSRLAARAGHCRSGSQPLTFGSPLRRFLRNRLSMFTPTARAFVATSAPSRCSPLCAA